MTDQTIERLRSTLADDLLPARSKARKVKAALARANGQTARIASVKDTRTRIGEAIKAAGDLADLIDQLVTEVGVAVTLDTEAAADVA